MGRRPIGERAMTDAERQRKRRAALRDDTWPTKVRIDMADGACRAALKILIQLGNEQSLQLCAALAREVADGSYEWSEPGYLDDDGLWAADVHVTLRDRND